MKSDKGAAATASRLEQHERDAESEINRIKSALEALRNEPPKFDGDDEKQKSLGIQISGLLRELESAYDLWFKLSKQVRDYYKAVDSSQREGEKILRADVERMLTNIWRFQRMGRETFIVAIAQDALRCKDEADFYSKYADGIRDNETEKIRAGIENEKFPEWVRECYERSL